MEEVNHWMTTAQQWIALYGLKLIAAIAILILGRIAAKIVRGAISKAMTRGNVDPTLVRFVTNLAYIGLMAFVVIAALGQVGIQTASFVAIIGAAGLAVGLALQGSLSNFAAGVLMIVFKPFKVGDFIEGAGTAGVVEEIGIFTTQLKTGDNKKIIVPNAKISGDNIVNYSANDTRRLDLTASCSYQDDLDQVRKVLEKILAGDERILKDPAPTLGVLNLGESSVDFAVRPWVKTADYWPVHFALQEAIKKQFDAAGISIPFPQRDIHVVNDKSA